MTGKSSGIFIKMSLLCFCSDIYNKLIHTINYFHTSISIASFSGLPVNQFRYKEKTMKWVVLRSEIAARLEICQTQSKQNRAKTPQNCAKMAYCTTPTTTCSWLLLQHQTGYRYKFDD